MTHPDSPIEDLMSPQPVALDPGATLADAFALLERYPFRHFPVVRLNELVGIVSDRDLFLASGLPRGKGSRGPRLAEIMRTGVRSVDPRTSARDAARWLLDQRIGALPVVSTAGRLVGIVTETDFLRAFQRSAGWPGRGPSATERAAEHMSTPVITVEEGTDLLEAAEMCLTSRVRHLPVLSSGRLVGMLSDRDIRSGLARLMRADRQSDGAREVPRLRVEDVMRCPCLTISPACTLRSAASTMIENRIGALPVVDEDTLVGILSQVDLLELYAGTKTLAAQGGERTPEG